MFKKNITLMGQTFKLAGDNQESINASLHYLTACFDDVCKENPDATFQAALLLAACRLAETLHILHKKHEETQMARASHEHISHTLNHLLQMIDQQR